MSKKEVSKTPKREVCIPSDCMDIKIDVETKEISFIPKEGAKCDIEAMKAFTTLYKDPTAKMKLIEKVAQKEE